jgi:siroheme synthase
VIYMGLGNLPGIRAALLEGGMEATTPACIIEDGTLPGQRQAITTLGNLCGDGFAGPAIIVIGEVVRLAALALPIPQARAA